MRKKRRMRYWSGMTKRGCASCSLEAEAVQSVRVLSSAFNSLARMMRRAAHVMRAFALPAWLVQTSAH